MPIDFFGLFFLGLGPGIAFFIVLIARKSFLVLLALFSAFLWLVVLLLISAIFRAFVPLSPTIGPYTGMLAASVFIEEAVRFGTWWLHRVTLNTLDNMARASGHRFGLLDKLYMAVAWGYGHGACHAVFFFLSLLPLTTGDGTLYVAECPQMSVFLVGALYALSFGMILTSLTVIAFDGYMTRNYVVVGAVAALHWGAAFLTLLNFQRDGCVVAMPVLVALGVLLTGYTVALCWKKGQVAR